MNEENIMAFIYMGLAALGGAGIVVGYWTVVRKSLRGLGEILVIREKDGFMQAMRGFLDARLSKNPIYSANPPCNNLELYEFYRKWMQRFDNNPWLFVAAAVTIQLLLGTLVIIYFSEDINIGSAFVLLFSCTALVVLISLICTWRIKKEKMILGFTDKRFLELIVPDRAALARSSVEEQANLEYRLLAIAAIPVLVSNDDIAANPRCMGEASPVVRHGLAFIAGLGVFLCFVMLGLAVAYIFNAKESVFPVFLFTGFIGIPVTWFSLLVFWEKRRQKLLGALRHGTPADGKSGR